MVAEAPGSGWHDGSSSKWTLGCFSPTEAPPQPSARARWCRSAGGGSVMTTRVFAALGVAALMMACESTFPAPTVVRGQLASVVATSRPDVWDSRDELAAW